MYVQAGVSARCGQILRLRARGQQGMRTERERGKWKLEGERGTGRCCASGANCFAQQRAAEGSKKAARTDGSFNVCGRRRSNSSSSGGSGGVQMFAAE